MAQYIFFFEESRFCVHPDNGHIFIWRESSTRNNPAFAQGSDRFGGGGMMVWAGISIDGRTDPHIIRNETLTGQRYRDEILKHIVVSYSEAIGYAFILMDDNWRPHRVHLVDDSFFEERTIREEWVACPPVINPIGHLGYSNQTSCCPPTAPRSFLRTGKSSSGGAG